MTPESKPLRSRRISSTSAANVGDRVTSRDAAPLIGCTNAEVFAIDRWAREQPCDRNGRRIQWPVCEEAISLLSEQGRLELNVTLLKRTIHEAVGFATLWRVPYLTTAQMKKNTVDDQVILRALKSARVAWSDQQYIRIPEWGGLKRPGCEWYYRRTTMIEWYERFLQGEATEPFDELGRTDPDASDRDHEVRAAADALPIRNLDP